RPTAGQHRRLRAQPAEFCLDRLQLRKLLENDSLKIIVRETTTFAGKGSSRQTPNTRLETTNLMKYKLVCQFGRLWRLERPVGFRCRYMHLRGNHHGRSEPGV